MDLLLTDQERERFAAWLEHEATVERGLIEQMEKLGPAFTLMVKHKATEAAAALVIAQKLRSTQSMTLG